MGRSGSKRVKMGMFCLSDEQADGSKRTVSNMVSPDNANHQCVDTVLTGGNYDYEQDMYAQVLEVSKKVAAEEEEARKKAEEARKKAEEARKKKEEDEMREAIQASLSGGQLP